MQKPTEKYGVISPFHAGGGGGGGAGGGGSAAGTHVFDTASYIVPGPHSAAALIPGDATVTNAIGMKVAAKMTAKRQTMPRTRILFTRSLLHQNPDPG